MDLILRPYQSKAVIDIGAAFDSGATSVLYSLPTGAGKTPIFAEVSRLCYEAGTRACILVHRDTLLRQACAKLNEFRVPHSVIAAGRAHFDNIVSVASVLTLVRRLARHEFDLLIIDEGHHATASTYRRIVAAWPSVRILGTTATPGRPDGRGLDGIYRQLIQGPSIAELQVQGYLARSDSYGPSRLVDMAGAHVRAGDWAAEDVQKAMDRSEITGDAIEHYLKLCPGQSALAFCATVKHAEDVAAQFRIAGVSAEAVSGRMEPSAIRTRLNALASGQLRVLASCDLVSEGFDAPGVSAIIMLRPTRSLIVYMQQCGRGLRPQYAIGMPLCSDAERRAAQTAGPKPNCIILDHAGNAFRHGLPEDRREWNLAGRAKRDSVPAIKACPICYAYCRAWVRTCPQCSHEFPAAAAQARMPDQVDGELARIDALTLARSRRQEERQCRTYEELLRLGRRRGYRPGWAWHRWRSRR